MRDPVETIEPPEGISKVETIGREEITKAGTTELPENEGSTKAETKDPVETIKPPEEIIKAEKKDPGETFKIGSSDQGEITKIGNNNHPEEQMDRDPERLKNREALKFMGMIVLKREVVVQNPKEMREKSNNLIQTQKTHWVF